LKRATVALFLLISCPWARGHQTLYEAIEVNLHDPAVIWIEFTIHAPELPSPLTAGLDPTAVDLDWLRGLSDGQISELTREAESFIRAAFELSWSDPDPSRPPPQLVAERIAFEAPELVRNPPADTKLPAGCLLGSMSLANPGPPRALRIGFAPDAQKRLMLAISRPAAFPQVHDLAPGESAVVALPEAPAPPAIHPSRRSHVVGVALTVTACLFLYLSLRNRRPRAKRSK